MLKQRLCLILQKSCFLLAIIFIILSCMISLARVATPFVQNNKTFVEHVASRILNHPVHFKKFTLQWVGANPFIDLHTVTISQLKIKRIGFSINLLHSLLHFRLLPNHLIVEGTELDLQQHNDRSWWVKGVGIVEENHNRLTSLKGFLYWLATQSNIVLDRVSVNVYFYNGEKFLLQRLKLQVRNNYLHHDIVGVGQLSESNVKEKNLKPFRFVIIPKNLQQGEANVEADFYLQIPLLAYQSAWAPLLFSELQLPLQFHSGKIKTEIWGKWRHGNFDEVQGKVIERDLVMVNSQVQHHLRCNEVNLHVFWRLQPTGWLLLLNPDRVPSKVTHCVKIG